MPERVLSSDTQFTEPYTFKFLLQQRCSDWEEVVEGKEKGRLALEIRVSMLSFVDSKSLVP